MGARNAEIERTYRDVLDAEGQPVELHLVMDNCAAHKHPQVKQWLVENPRFVVHIAPTHASWMNLVEVWFGIVERQAIRRGVFKSVTDLNTKIRTFYRRLARPSPAIRGSSQTRV